MTGQQPLRCAIIGCGQVAAEYLATLRRAHDLVVTRCADIDPDTARNFAARHDIPRSDTPGRVLTDGGLDIAVILTPPHTHLAIARDALDAGAHTYVEKPLGPAPADTAALLEHAHQRGLLVGAAPDTVLAPPTCAAQHALESGVIGTPLAGDAALLAPGPETWHEAPHRFYAQEAGPLGDMGPYYLATLIYLLGPIAHIEAATTSTRAWRTIRTGPHNGESFPTHAPTHVAAFLRTRRQALITLTTSFDIAATTRPHLEIYGTDGTLVLPDPNFHHGPVRYRRRGDPTWHELNQHHPLRPTGRGIGVIDLAETIRAGAPHCPSGHRAHHIVEIIHTIAAASDSPHSTGPRSLGEKRHAGLP